MRFVFLSYLALATLVAGAQSDPSRSLNTPHGFSIFLDGEQKIWRGGGDQDPTAFPGFDAPIGSSYRRTTGQVYNKVGPLTTDWVLQGLQSQVFTQTADFGRSGNVGNNSFLRRAGNVASNTAGIPVLVGGSAYIISAVCTTRNVDTFNVEIFEHDGNFTNANLILVIPVVSSRVGSLHGLNISVTQDRQLAARMDGTARNPACSLGMKGTSL